MIRVLIACLAIFAALSGAAQDAEPDAPAESGVYTIRHGDTLYDLARHFAVPLDDLLASNDIEP